MLVAIISALTIFVFFIKKNTTVVADGKQIKTVILKKTLGSSLSSAEVNSAVKDNIESTLSLNRARKDIITVNLKVFVDNKEFNIKSTPKNIAIMLNCQNITLSDTDKVSPPIETKISTGMNVVITRVKTETIKQTKPIEFKTVIKKDNKSLKSQSKVSQKGIQGKKSLTLNLTYENGKEVSRKMISEVIVNKPQNKIIVQGTMPQVAISRGDSSISSKKTVNVDDAKSSGKIINVKATAYWAFNGVNNTYTSSGAKAVRNPSGYSTIAVDPGIIPLGTKLYVEGYGNAIASDKGSGIKGNFIDVYFNTRKEALNWGVKYLKVQILD